MYTSDTEKVREKSAKAALAYLLIALFCAFFGAVYEVFSHEVYSFYMIYAFVFPLAGGALPFLALSIFGGRRVPGASARNLYHFGIAALTVGSILQGVLDIYGTTNGLLRVYWIVGAALTAAGALLYLIFPRKKQTDGI